jgi:NodT family efflux transporter outer membrane factor (OMF) lipoprotein
MLAVVTLAGCGVVGKDAATPGVEMPAAYSGLSPSAGSPQGVRTRGGRALPGVEIAAWWRRFDDPTLNELVERGLSANHDLRLALSAVRESRALLGEAASGRWPAVDAPGSVQRQRFSENVQNSFPGAGEASTAWRAGLDASWEIDLWGGVRRGVEAARADMLASEEGARGVRVSVAAEIARNYIDLRSAQQRLMVLDRAVAAQEQTLRLTAERVRTGIAPEVEVSQARSRLANRRALRPALSSQERAANHRLCVLLGVAPGALDAELGKPAEIPRLASAASEIEVGLPSELLLRRPDLRAAERRVRAATARIGVAEADLFPRFSLTGALGVEADRASRLTDSGSEFWNVGPTVRWNIFDAGRIRARINAAEEREKQALIGFERAALVALEDVENALSLLRHEQDRTAHLREAREASARALELSRARYAAGLGDLLDVLDSEQQFHDAEDQERASEAAVSAAVLGVYKSLGGGWGG